MRSSDNLSGCYVLHMTTCPTAGDGSIQLKAKYTQKDCNGAYSYNERRVLWLSLYQGLKTMNLRYADNFSVDLWSTIAKSV